MSSRRIYDNKKDNKDNKDYKNYIMIPNEMTHYAMISGKSPWCLKPKNISDEYGD